MSELWERGEHPAQAEILRDRLMFDGPIGVTTDEDEEDEDDGEVTLRYYVPVDVIVNLGEERVTRVVILDEDVRLDLDISQDDEAVRIAEVADWPEWENSY
jgi:hypothetical protein